MNYVKVEIIKDKGCCNNVRNIYRNSKTLLNSIKKFTIFINDLGRKSSDLYSVFIIIQGCENPSNKREGKGRRNIYIMNYCLFYVAAIL